MEERERWAREEEEWTRRKEWEEDTKIRERRGKDGDGEPCAWCCWEELVRGEGRRAIAAVAMASARATARM
jgi:hypothetical protein